MEEAKQSLELLPETKTGGHYLFVPLAVCNRLLMPHAEPEGLTLRHESEQQLKQLKSMILELNIAAIRLDQRERRRSKIKITVSLVVICIILTWAFTGDIMLKDRQYPRWLVSLTATGIGLYCFYTIYVNYVFVGLHQNSRERLSYELERFALHRKITEDFPR